MLLELNIENFAIIDKVSVQFSDGFNVLTGETGAGKSIIIDAVNLALGGRGGKDYIRTGATKAVIEAVFLLNKSFETKKLIAEFGLDDEGTDTIIISRELYDTGRSISRVNGRTVTLNMLKELTNKLIDIHGQHEHQSLLDEENHISFIDLLGKSIIIDLKDKINMDYNKVKNLKKSLSGLAYDDKERERKIDLLKFQIKEIEEADLKENEEETLMDEFKVLSSTEEIKSKLNSVIEVMHPSDYNEVSVIDHLNTTSGYLKEVVNMDKTLEKLKDSFEIAFFQLQDVIRELRNHTDTIEYDPERLKELEDRIDLINRLKRKYGKEVQDIFIYKDEITSELDWLINSEEEITRLQSEIDSIEKSIYENCEELSKKRQKISKAIEEDITKELMQLNMPNVSFKIDFKRLDKYTRRGIDKIEFLISTNIGEPLKPLSRIVSGGEMSRIMLAFKTILAEVDNISCLIFDEIDTGISGRTAQVISEKIGQISRTHQVLCITHLPQIAAMADRHFQISKVVKNNKTNTNVFTLNKEDRIEELSRLLGGVDLTDTTKKHAMEMIKMTDKIKKKWL